MSDDEATELSARVQDAIADAVRAHEGAMLVKYAAAVEVIDPAGERALWVLATADLKAWETVGMLEYARDIERAATVAAAIEDES